MEDEARKRVEQAMRRVRFTDPMIGEVVLLTHAIDIAVGNVEEARAEEKQRADRAELNVLAARDMLAVIMRTRVDFAAADTQTKRAEAAERALSDARKAATEANDRHHEVMLKAERRVAELEAQRPKPIELHEYAGSLYIAAPASLVKALLDESEKRRVKGE